jgi:hypothetical protein
VEDRIFEGRNWQTDARCQLRFKIRIQITINSRACAVLNEITVDVSESEIAALLPIDRFLDPNVDLNFKLGSLLIKKTLLDFLSHR